MKKAVVLGAGGFIGGHLMKRLKEDGYWVRGVDIKHHEYDMERYADDFVIANLERKDLVEAVIDNSIDEVYQLAALMGGAEFIFTGDNDAAIMYSSALINLNVVSRCQAVGCKVFYSSSACMYPAYNQEDPENPNCAEHSAYPAAPDSEYGWEKLFSERLYLAYHKNYGLKVRIARFHNIFGEKTVWKGGKEKAPAAICRKIAQCTPDNNIVEVFGDGEQTRSFLYIDECIEGIRKQMDSDFIGPVNIGSDEMVTINTLVSKVAMIANKHVTIRHIPGPLGVRGRNSQNDLIRDKLGWAPTQSLSVGLARTYDWIAREVSRDGDKSEQLGRRPS